MFSPSHYEEWVIGIRGSRFWASEMKISISYGWFMHVWISEVGRDFIWVQIVKNSFTSTDLLFLSSTLTLFKVRDGELKKRKRSREKRRRVLFFGTKNISKRRRKSAFTVEKRKKQISNASFEKVVKTMRKNVSPSFSAFFAKRLRDSCVVTYAALFVISDQSYHFLHN